MSILCHTPYQTDRGVHGYLDQPSAHMVIMAQYEPWPFSARSVVVEVILRPLELNAFDKLEASV